MPPPHYAPVYCSFPHRLSDGVPVGHRCRVLPVAYLEAELKLAALTLKAVAYTALLEEIERALEESAIVLHDGAEE